MTASDQRKQRVERAHQHAAHCKSRFREAGNPTFAWEVIGGHLPLELSLPKWVREYLLDVAHQMHQLSRARIPHKTQIARAVAEAAGLEARGRFNPFRELGQPTHEISVASDVNTYQTKNRHYSWQAIFADVARVHSCELCTTKPLSAASVKRYWYAHALAVIPPHLVKAAPSQKLDDILR